jgi:hypothetical protein
MDFLREREGLEGSVMARLGYRVMDLGGDAMMRLASYVRTHVDSFPTANKNAEPSAPPNGGPAERFGNSEVTGGPPSVS